MHKKDLEFLSELVEAPSPSGFEQPAAKVFRDRLSKTADTVETNVMGSVHAVLKGTKPGGVSVMLAGHIDEIGLMVNYITPEGFIAASAIGGVDAAILPGMRVRVHTEKGTLLGIMGRKPIHLIEDDERKNVTKLEKLFIDVGMAGEKVKKRVRIGDPDHVRRRTRDVRRRPRSLASVRRQDGSLDRGARSRGGQEGGRLGG